MSGVLVVADVLCLVVGVKLVVQFPNALRMLGGLVLIAVAVEIRPRIPPLRVDGDELGAADAPAFRSLVARIAGSLGASQPDVIAVNDSFNASCGRGGLRQRSVLEIGLPLWASLSDHARTAVLSHELGHLVNGDPGRRLLCQPALTTFGVLADVLDPDGLGSRDAADDLVVNFAVLLMWPVLWPLSRGFLALHLLMHRIAARDAVAAEYFADRAAARVAGSRATLEGLTWLLYPDTALAVARAARLTADPTAWFDAAANVQRVDQGEREARTIADASALDSHPPLGYRLAALRAWPEQAPSVDTSASESGRINTELAPHYQRIHRRLQNPADARRRAAA